MPLFALEPREYRDRYNLHSMERHRVAVLMSRVMGVTTVLVHLLLHIALQDPRLGQQARTSHEMIPA